MKRDVSKRTDSSWFYPGTLNDVNSYPHQMNAMDYVINSGQWLFSDICKIRND